MDKKGVSSLADGESLEIVPGLNGVYDCMYPWKDSMEENWIYPFLMDIWPYLGIV